MLAHYHFQQQHQIIHQINLYVLIPQQDASEAESKEGPPMSSGGRVEW